MMDLAKKNVEWEPESALSKSYNGKGQGVFRRHDGVVIPSQPQIDVSWDSELLPKVLKFGRGISLMSPHTHDIGFFLKG